MAEIPNVSHLQFFWAAMGAGVVLYLLGVLSVLIPVILGVRHYLAKMKEDLNELQASADDVLETAKQVHMMKLDRIELHLRAVFDGLYAREPSLDWKVHCFSKLAIAHEMLLQIGDSPKVVNEIKQILGEFAERDWGNINMLNDWRARISAIRLYVRHLRRPIGENPVNTNWTTGELADLRPGIGWTVNRLKQGTLPWTLGRFALSELLMIREELSIAERQEAVRRARA